MLAVALVLNFITMSIMMIPNWCVGERDSGVDGGDGAHPR
jgi:hypothetical protein